MKVGILLFLVVISGCSSGRIEDHTSKSPVPVNDFYLDILEIKSNLHHQILDLKPWIALQKEPVRGWSLYQISDWLSLRYSREVEQATLLLLKTHLLTADPKLAYTRDVEETCWAEVDRLIKSQLLKTAIVVSNKANLHPSRPIQEIIHDSIAAHTP